MSYVLDVLEHLYTEYRVADDEESVDAGDDVKSRLRPAIIHPATRKLYMGKRGDLHQDIMHKHYTPDELMSYDTEMSRWDHTGFYDPHTRKFHKASAIELDATDLMTPIQRMRKLGTESITI